MKQEESIRVSLTDNKEVARQCLGLIGEIACRGARSLDPEHIACVLQELRQVLFRTGQDETLFEPGQKGQISGLIKLHHGLEVVDCISHSLFHGLMETALSPAGRVYRRIQ